MNMNMVNAYDGAGDSDPLIARRRRVLGPAYRLFYEQPLHIVRGEGVWLFDAEGRRYLDAYNNVASVGHCHPEVVAALARQASTLNTHTRYLHEGILEYGERLLRRMPTELGHVMFACTGSEANDLALRIAGHVTGGQGVIVTRLAYHGNTTAIAAISPSLGPAVGSTAHVRTVPAPDGYRGPADVAAALTAAVGRAVEDLRTTGVRPAALIVDTLFTSDGVFADPAGFLTGAVEAIRNAGGLFIADEVQAGLGRVGQPFWGFVRHGVVPDIVTAGKPLGNGHPIAAVFSRPELLQDFGSRIRYFNTFGGNPVSAAVGLAVLDVIERARLDRAAERTGEAMMTRLRALAARHAAIGDVRGAGLFIGCELVSDAAARTPDPDRARRVVNSMRQRGVLISACGPDGNVLKIRPPLVFGPDHVDMFIETFEACLRDGSDGA